MRGRIAEVIQRRARPFFQGGVVSWSTIRWGRLLLWLVVILPGVPFVIASASMVGYIYLPRPYWDLEIPRPEAGVREVLLSAHGVYDTPQSWSAPLTLIQQENHPDARGLALDWSEYATSSFRCSVDGSRIGKKIGSALAAFPDLRTVHLVAHSCGSFVILNICRMLKEVKPGVAIQATYLDPVSIYGGFFWDYGINNFGSCADFSEAYIDTGDGVPGSNGLLPQTHTFDVTDARLSYGVDVNPHVWPTLYYTELVRQNHAPSLARSDDLAKRFPRGILEKIESAFP